MSEPTISAAQLRAAADLIEPRGKWARKFYALDRNGQPKEPNEDGACRWCAVGAVARVAELDPEKVESLVFRLGGYGENGLTHINDSHGKRAAIAELRRLADLAEARERGER